MMVVGTGSGGEHTHISAISSSSYSFPRYAGNENIATENAAFSPDTATWRETYSSGTGNHVGYYLVIRRKYCHMTQGIVIM